MTQARKLTTRLYVDAALTGSTLRLTADQAHYIGRVLRCREGQSIVLFNANGLERAATIRSLAKRNPVVELAENLEPLPESPVQIILLQALVKSDAMDLIVQKATELGVARIFAVKTEFSVVRLDAERRQSRLAHWQRIALSACEQSGRHRPPELAVFPSLDESIAAVPAAYQRFAFALGAVAPLDAQAVSSNKVCLAIGPEGGFSPMDVEALDRGDFARCSLGPRTLRAETAAIAACAGLQLMAGDLGRPSTKPLPDRRAAARSARDRG
jgi:16S rRNA (uracil1498-N3)-methyltransferase